mgnify:CR=1 FL=1
MERALSDHWQSMDEILEAAVNCLVASAPPGVTVEEFLPWLTTHLRYLIHEDRVQKKIGPTCYLRWSPFTECVLTFALSLSLFLSLHVGFRQLLAFDTAEEKEFVSALLPCRQVREKDNSEVEEEEFDWTILPIPPRLINRMLSVPDQERLECFRGAEGGVLPLAIPSQFIFTE